MTDYLQKRNSEKRKESEQKISLKISWDLWRIFFIYVKFMNKGDKRMVSKYFQNLLEDKNKEKKIMEKDFKILDFAKPNKKIVHTDLRLRTTSIILDKPELWRAIKIYCQLSEIDMIDFLHDIIIKDLKKNDLSFVKNIKGFKDKKQIYKLLDIK